MAELTEEEVLSNDKDPLEAIAEIRREEAKAEEKEKEKEENEEEVSPETTVDNDESTNEMEDENTNEDEEKEDQTEGEEKDTPKVHKFKADGIEYEFTEQEMIDQFGTVFGKAVNYTHKTQEIAPYRRMISAIKEENITEDQLNLALDILKGNKDAIKTLIKEQEIDPFELSDEEDTKSDYVPNVYGKDELQLNLEEVTNRIVKDPESKTTIDVIDNQWDDNSRLQLMQNPSLIEGLHNDVKTGTYDKVAPIAMKMKLLDDSKKSDIEYYIAAGEQLFGNTGNKPDTKESQETVQSAQEKFDKASSEANEKRSASATQERADRNSVTDYLDDDDEKFEEWLKNLKAAN